VLISTGSQGEPLSALSRMANRSHHQIRIEAQDTVVLASSLIPGNENAVLPRHQRAVPLGARVVHKGVAKVHVSGHASAGELLYLLNATRPSNVMPVHGEWRHLRAHAELARLTGVPAEPDRARRGRRRRRPRRRQGRDRRRRSRAATSSSTARGGRRRRVDAEGPRILGDEGFISVTLAVDSVTGKIAGGPEISARGFSDDRPRSTRSRCSSSRSSTGRRRGRRDAQALQQLVRRAVGRWVNDAYRRRPMIIPVVVEV
jgi:ribonuclease J